MMNSTPGQASTTPRKPGRGDSTRGAGGAARLDSATVGRRRRIRWCLGVALAGAAGCGPGGPVLVPVQGRLLLDGEPLPGKHVLFSPADGTPGLGAGATSRPDGSFVLLATLAGATRDCPGVMPGRYRVVVSEPLFPVDETVPAGSSGSEPQPAFAPRFDRPARSEIPRAYCSVDTTPLTIEIKPGEPEVTLELASKPR